MIKNLIHTANKMSIIDSRQNTQTQYFDVVQCNNCGTVQAVNCNEDTCKHCGIVGALMDIEQDVNISNDEYILTKDGGKND